MKYLFILIAGVLLSALFHYMFGEADWLKKGLFIGLTVAVGQISGVIK